MKSRHRILASFSILILLTFAASPRTVNAQTGAGALHGQVLDPSGGAVVGASVVLTTPSADTLVATTDQQGVFDRKGLPPGKYSVQVIAKGFAIYKNDDVEITADKVQQLKVALEIEQQQEKVVVSDEAPTVDVNPANNAGAIIISGKELEALPDDPDELQSDLTALAGPSAGPNGGQFYIDGFTAGQLPPKSAIREIRINQNPFSAQYDKVGYGRIEIFTKPGADKWHGQISVNGNDSSFNSKNPFFHQDSSATPFPPYYSVQYSGNIGGPLSKKASFFFTTDIRDINDLSIVNAQIVDTTSPNFPIVPFSDAVPTPKRRYNLGPRLDYQLSGTNTLSVRYQYYRDNVQNDGITAFSLPTQAFNLLTTEHTLQVSDTQTLGPNVVNETRFQYLHQTSSQVPQNTATTLLVQGAFVGGGSNDGTVLDTSNRYELQNYTSISHGTHFIKFGVRLRGVTDSNFSTTGFNGEYIFPSIQAYQAALAIGAQNASQFLLTAGPTAGMPGNPLASVGQVDVGLYAEDDWRIRPNITLSYGLRFESQNDISNHANWAPRLGFAWGLGGGGKAAPKTVLRAGFGIFYDRFNSSYVLQEDRLNGIRQAQFIFTNPDFFPNTVPTSTVSPSVYAQASHLRAPYVMQTAVSLERQVTKFANVSLSYLNSRGWDQLFTNNINSPDPGTFDFPFYTSPTPGVRPIAGFENVYQFQSEGIYRENQMFLQATIRAGARLTLFSYYTLTYANSDTSSATAFPSNPRNIMQDYGRSPFDIRNRYFLGGTIGLPHNFRLSPFMIVSSGTPFNITLSQDLIGTAQFNQRPTFANGATGPTIVTVPGIGSFNTVPSPNATPIPVDFLTSPSRFTLNARLSKTFGFGKESGSGGQQTVSGGPGGGGGGGGAGRGGGGGGGGRAGGPFAGGPGGLGGGGTNRRYNVTLSVNARNLFNYRNADIPSGVLNPPTADVPQASASPFFNVPNHIFGQPFSSPSASRLIYLQAAFSF
ncbi:MAG TPA: carboxypeptidase regulatory-like domain-containing protein [Candidatus Dormibacteraeota bacterium]|nr:carboxypeptidase regulatory-like domain-containing protein [Candidatus Dormibacteraeota bacterium]